MALYVSDEMLVVVMKDMGTHVRWGSKQFVGMRDMEIEKYIQTIDIGP